MIALSIKADTPEEVAGQREELLRRYPPAVYATFIGPVKEADGVWVALGYREEVME